MAQAIPAIVALLALLAPPGEGPPSPIGNPGFEEVAREGATAGWELAPPSARTHYRLDTVAGDRGQAGRLAPVEGAPAEAFGAALQSFDAAGWSASARG